MKIIAFYLPQFHDIPENDEWWGKGFTEWVNVKKAKPQFEGHCQPRVPLDGNYYNLLDDEVKIWQAQLAKKYGVYGFCYYHYWFNGKLLLEKPMEQMLANKNIDIPFCISWANEPWTKHWVGEKDTLIPQLYGEEPQWKEHYDYLKPFFKDDRYIKVGNRPLFMIYRAEVIADLNKMLDYWNSLAVEDGYDGLCFAYQGITFDKIGNKDDSRFDYDIEFQPDYALWDLSSKSALKKTYFWKKLREYKRRFFILIEHIVGFDTDAYIKLVKKRSLVLVDYDEIWEAILKKTPESKKSIPGAFVRWDNTPRYGNMGRVSKGDSPEKFENYMKAQIKNARGKYNSDMMFMFAWNEWAEGGFLEPDEENKYAYLEALRQALLDTNEFPY